MLRCIYSLKKAWEAVFPTFLRDIVNPTISIKSYDLKQESKPIIYLDSNNLYVYAVSKFLPIGWFKWIDPEELGSSK